MAPRRILLVEDNPINRKLAVAMLEKWGHQVVLADTGQEAVDLCADRLFDLLLMNLQMPDMSASDAAAAIRARRSAPGPSHLRIVALSANATAVERERCLAAGMDDCLASPIRSAELRAVLDRWGAKP